MLYITINPTVFHAETGRAPFKGMSTARQRKVFITLESSGSEIGVIPFSPPLSSQVRKPRGQNTFRTLNISLTPTQIDETLIAKSFIQNQGYLVNKIIAAVADGLVLVHRDAIATPLTAAELSTLFFG